MKLNKVLLGLLLAAPTSMVVVAKPAPVIDITNSTANTVVLSSSKSLEDKITQLERQLTSRNRAQVNMQRQLDDLQNEVNELRGVTELHSHQLTQVLERQRELYQELDRRVSEALATSKEPSVNVMAPNVELPTNYSSDLTENEAYDRAVNMVLKDKRYEEAIPEFRAFNQKYPQSTYAPNSHYWLGQLLFNKGNLDEAKVEFTLVVEKHLKSIKRADALLKLAMVEQKQNNIAKAQTLYQQVLSEYPKTNAAQLAGPRLKTLEVQ